MKTIQSIKSELQDGYRAFSGARLADAKAVFKSALLGLLLVPTTSDAEAAEVRTFLTRDVYFSLTSSHSGVILLRQLVNTFSEYQ